MGERTIALKEIQGGGYQVLKGGKELAMGDLPPVMAPKHLDGIEPRAVSGQIQKHKASCGTADNRFNGGVFVGIGIVPSDINGFLRMFFKKKGEKLSDFLPPLMLAHDNRGVTGMIVDAPDAINAGGVARCGNHHLLPFRGPHGPQGRQPTDVELIGIVEDFARFQVVALAFNRRFFT